MYKSLEKIYQEFLTFEDRHNLLRNNDRVSLVWEQKRLAIFQMVARSQHVYYVGSLARKHNTGIDNFRNLKSLLAGFLTKNPFLRKTRRRYAFWNHPRRVPQEVGCYCDVYTDPIIRFLGNQECVAIERPWKFRHFNPTCTSYVFYQDFIDFISLLVKQFHKSSLSRTEIAKLKRIEGELFNQFKVKISLQSTASGVLSELRIRRMLLYLLLLRMKPEIVFLVASNVHGALIQASRLARIPTVEIQHGLLSKYYIPLSYPKNRKKQTAPDYFLTFGDFWKTQIDMPVDVNKQLSIGFPYLRSSLSKYPGAKMQKLTVISQPTVASSLLRILEELTNNTGGLPEIVYKLHPEESADWRERYPVLLDLMKAGRITVVDNTGPQLYELLAKSLWVLGVYSTALLESVAFGCACFILNAPGAENVQPLVQQGVFQLVNDARDLRAYLGKAPNGKLAENVFEPDWRNRLRSALAIVEQFEGTRIRHGRVG